MNKETRDLLATARARRATLETAFANALRIRPESERRTTFDLYIPKLAAVNAEIIELTK